MLRRSKKEASYVDPRSKDAHTGRTVLFGGPRLERTLKHCLLLSFGLAVMASAATYVLAFFLFTIHEEIGISADAALPIAVWTFPIVFLEASLATWPGKLVVADVDGTMRFQRRNTALNGTRCRFKSSTS